MSNLPSLDVKEVSEGKNSVLFNTGETFALYEKLSNTIHCGDKDILNELKEEIESFEYNPFYEVESLNKKRGGKIESLLLNVTESCNLACKYCIYSGNYENERTTNNSKMDFETARKTIDLFIPKSEERALIAFYGGEPLNNMPLINKVIAYVGESYPLKEAIFSMTTNFYDVDKRIEDIVNQEVYLNISLDGPKEVHDKFRIDKKGNSTWHKIMENLKKLEGFSPGYVKNHVGMSVSCADPNDFNMIVDYFLENQQFKVIRMGGIEQKGLKASFGKKSVSQNVCAYAQEYLEDLSLGIVPPNILKTFFDQGLKRMSTRSRKEMPDFLMLNGSCYPGTRKLFVDTDGQFYMCEKFGKRMSIGDIDIGIRQEAVDDSINRFQQIRNELCTSGCWAQRICTPCIHSAKDPKGEISIKGLSEICSSSKTEALVILSLYTALLKESNQFVEKYFKRININ